MRIISLVLLMNMTFVAYSQNITVTISVQSSKKVPHRNIRITATNSTTNAKYEGVSNNSGVATMTIKEGGRYVIKLSNSQVSRILTIPYRPGLKMSTTFMYNGGNDDWSKKYPPTKEQLIKWEQLFKATKDTTYTKIRSKPKQYDKRFVYYKLHIKNITDGPLVNEIVYFSADKHHKVFTGKTDLYGNVYMLLPKGYGYSINFKYDSNYQKLVLPLTRARSRRGTSLTYLGTKEIEKRSREKALRIKREEKRLAREEAEYKEYLKRSKKRAEEVLRDEIKALAKRHKNSIINKVFERNKWTKKLIVCDLTGSMRPYAAQLSNWYALNYALNKDMQFVFFNDGDNKIDGDKEIGSTGGIYYSPNINVDNLITLIVRVQNAGSGGDCPENNMEALIYGTEKAEPYNDIIMIVDNNAPVKDISLLSKFNKPVHIILCGVNNRVEEDYLQIAYKTRGSIHTMEQDLSKLWQMAEGKTISISGSKYKLLKGKFIKIAN